MVFILASISLFMQLPHIRGKHITAHQQHQSRSYYGFDDQFTVFRMDHVRSLPLLPACLLCLQLMLKQQHKEVV